MKTIDEDELQTLNCKVSWKKGDFLSPTQQLAHQVFFPNFSSFVWHVFLWNNLFYFNKNDGIKQKK